MKTIQRSTFWQAGFAFLYLLSIGSSSAVAQDSQPAPVRAEPEALSGRYQDLTGQRNFVVKSLGNKRFSISCEDWESTLIWGKNTGGYSGVFRFVDEPTVETNAAFQPGGSAQNAVGFVQILQLEDGSFELKFRWWLNDSEKSWSYRMIKSTTN